MNYIRTFKEQLDFTGKLIDIYDAPCDRAAYPWQDREAEGLRYPKGTYLALRVISGEILLQCKNEFYRLKQDAFFMLPARQIDALESRQEATYHLYHFTSEKAPVFFNAGKVYYIPYGRQEEQIKQMMLLPERETNLAANTALISLFRVMYCTWIYVYENKDSAHSLYEKEIRQAAEMIEQNLGEKINFAQLGQSFLLSERNFRKRFHQILGMSPKAYQQEMRLKSAATLLKQGHLSIAEISEELGYYSQFQFSRDFKKRFGVTPSAYKNSI